MTEATIYKVLSETLFAGPAYILLPQVRNGTGYSRQVRTCDALAVSVWPSKGIFAHGIEIKVTRGDWKREMDAPEKAAAIRKWCRFWSIAAPPGVVREFDDLNGCGSIEVKDGKAKMVRPPSEQEPEPWDASFVASVLRSASIVSVPAVSIAERLKDSFERGQDCGNFELMTRIEHLTATLDGLRQEVEVR